MAAIDVLLIGSGGREHALAWKLAQSPALGTLYAAPGNPGIGSVATLVPLDPADTGSVVGFCREKGIGLVVIGPEAPLVAGLADALRANGIAAFGPSAAAARLEGSKGFTKDLCTLHDIPTAAYGRFSDAAAAKDFVAARGAPIVVKADGLASGKGVTVAETAAEACAAIDACFVAGDAGAEVVVEEFLEGREASLFCLCDGEIAVLFGTAEDHKRAFDDDRGPNTGGMGAYSPAAALTPAVLDEAMRRIVRPTLRSMREAGAPFAGVLYAGLMVTRNGPKLIEYNVRFGDPEAQALMLRLESDLLPILLAAARGELSGVSPRWRDAAAVCVVMAAQGYPGAIAVPDSPIRALPPDAADAVVFHAGTRREGNALVASGGRVLGAAALGMDVTDAARRAYALVAAVDWPDGFHRTDIGAKAMSAGPD